MKVNIKIIFPIIKNLLLLVRFGRIPVALFALIVGTILGWGTQLNQAADVRNAVHIVKSYPLVYPIKELFLHMSDIAPFLSVAIPTALSIAVGTIPCAESARRVGDIHPTRESNICRWNWNYNYCSFWINSWNDM